MSKKHAKANDMQNPKKLIPISISDYKTIIENNYYYVDKTLLVSDIYKPGQVILVTRPRRFGKTLNLSMLRYFFEKSDTTTHHLFQNTLINQDKRFKELQGQFPVIFVSFKNIKESNWDLCHRTIVHTIGQEYARHKHLLEGEVLDAHEKRMYKSILEGTSAPEVFNSSLQFLSQILYRKYKKKVIVLIDEYDVPIQAAYVNGFYEPAVDLLRSLYSAVLKDNDVIELGVVTGILTLARSGIFTGLNNLDAYNLTDQHMSDKFGFTHEEVVKLLEYYEMYDSKEAIEKWYDGYTFGRNTKIYNPWSLIKCISRDGSLERYWVNTSDNILIKKLIAASSRSVKIELETVLRDKTFDQKIEESMTFPVLDRRTELFWSLLLFTGYLTYEHYEVKEGWKVAALSIPNEEIKHLYIDLIQQMFAELSTDADISDFLAAFVQGEVALINTLLQQFVMKSMSYFDIPNTEPEKSYHLFVLGLLVAQSGHYSVKSNRESGIGRYDIMIMPKNQNEPAIVIEFKKVLPGETLETAAQKAVDQIKEKNYVQELYDLHYKNVRAYGIAFEGKQVLTKQL